MRATPGVSVGTYWSSEPAENVFDGRKNTVYTNHGACNVSWLSIECGENTGLYLKLNNEPRALVAFYLCTNSYGFARDPLQITIEGSQAPENVLDSGSQWTLIYNGSSGLLSNPGRAGQGALMRLANISVAYSSFRLLTVSKKGNESSVSFSEWSLLMY